MTVLIPTLSTAPTISMLPLNDANCKDSFVSFAYYEVRSGLPLLPNYCFVGAMQELLVVSKTEWVLLLSPLMAPIPVSDSAPMLSSPLNLV